MNALPSLPAPKRPRVTPQQRQQFISEFERSGLSAIEFARLQGVAYSTFTYWLKKATTRPEVDVRFAEVEMIQPATTKPVIVELGSVARLQLSSPDQLELVAGLLKHLQV